MAVTIVIFAAVQFIMPNFVLPYSSRPYPDQLTLVRRILDNQRR